MQLEYVDYIVVTFSENNPVLQRLKPIQESAWVVAPTSDWSYRLDPIKPEMKQQRHVHIAKTKWTNAKTNQYSWNQNGTRHDRKTFCKSEKGVVTAKQIASDVLGVSVSVLESTSPAICPMFLTESAIFGESALPEHTIYLTFE